MIEGVVPLTHRIVLVRSRPGRRSHGWLTAGSLRIAVTLGRTGILADKWEGDGGTPAGRFRPVRLWWRADRLPRPNWSELLTRIAQSMPDDVWLDGLTFVDGQTVNVTGASYADGGVYDFVNYLKQIPGVADIALQGTGVGRSTTGPTTSFNLQLSLVPASGRND